MRVLLDAHVYVWWLQGSTRLGREARRVVESPGSQVFVSAASIWELSIKRGLGKLRRRTAVLWRRAVHQSVAMRSFLDILGTPTRRDPKRTR